MIYSLKSTFSRLLYFLVSMQEAFHVIIVLRIS
nr:MAG TPA: hypothetical protein [Caudoviricetes sp.]